MCYLGLFGDSLRRYWVEVVVCMEMVFNRDKEA